MKFDRIGKPMALRIVLLGLVALAIVVMVVMIVAGVTWASRAIATGPDSAWLYSDKTPSQLKSSNSAERLHALLAYCQGNDRSLTDLDMESFREVTVRDNLGSVERHYLVKAYQYHFDILVPDAHRMLLEIAKDPSIDVSIKKRNIQCILSVLKDVDGRFEPAFAAMSSESVDFDSVIAELPRE
jgi:hypothetical protein